MKSFKMFFTETKLVLDEFGNPIIDKSTGEPKKAKQKVALNIHHNAMYFPSH